MTLARAAHNLAVQRKIVAHAWQAWASAEHYDPEHRIYYERAIETLRDCAISAVKFACQANRFAVVKAIVRRHL